MMRERIEEDKFFVLLFKKIAGAVQCDGDTACLSFIILLFPLMPLIIMSVYTCQYANDKIKQLLKYLNSDWEIPKGDKELSIMKTYAANGKRIFYVYSGMIYLAVMFCFLIVPLIPKALDIVLPLNESRPASLPYEANYFVDSDKYYYFIILHIFVCLEILATLVIAKDNIVLGCIQHVCSIFTVAGHRFDVVSRYSDNNSTNSLHAINMYNKKIALSVYAHQQALRFVDLLEDTFCYPSLIHMFIIVVALTFTLMMLAVKFDDQIIDVPRKTIVLLCLLSQIFYYCMQGQRLIDHSEEAREKIYNSSWYNIPPKSQKMLLFVMLTNMEPNTITAGKIFTFSLETFARVVQSSVSYYTVLASMM